MIRQARGYNAILLPWQGIGFPNNLQPTRGAAALTWDEFGAQLAAHGVNRLRVKFCGWNGPLGSSVPSFEPRTGQFNDWGGYLQQFVEMCRAHDVQIHAIPFDNAEWVRDDAWSRHGWNSSNGGFLLDRRDSIASVAYSAAEARIDALIGYAGDVIGAWELCAEMTWMINPGFWGVADWGAMDGVVYDVAVPWVEHLAQYIHAHHPAPVGNGQVFAPSGFNDVALLRNEVHRTPSLDFALINWYGRGSVQSKVAYLRECQEYTRKAVYVEQYAPWSLNRETPYTPEPDTLAPSKEHGWAAACGEYGFSGPMRWPEIRPVGQVSEWWGVAHPNMAEIAGVTTEMAEAIDLSEWAGVGEAWDARISGAVNYVVSWGDGAHLTAFVAWDGSSDTDLEIEDLDDGEYVALWFDWIDGDLLIQQPAHSAGGILTLFDAPDRLDHSALYLTRQSVTPPQPTRLMLRFSREGTVPLEVTIEAGQVYQLDVLEAA